MIATSALGIRRKKTGLALLTNGNANESRRKGPSRKGGRRAHAQGKRRELSTSSIESSSSTGGSALVYTSPRRLDVEHDEEEEGEPYDLERQASLSNPTQRWEHMSELAGTHRQDPTVLDVSNRNMPPSALKFGVPPTVAHAVVDLRFGSVGPHDLPEFLDVVSTLFPNLKRMSLQRNHRPAPPLDTVPNNKQATQQRRSPLMMEPNTNTTDSRMANPGPACIFEPSASLLAAADREAARMQRLYILYRLIDLEELNDTCVSEEERRLARPNCPSGHRVKRGDWLTGAMAPTSGEDTSILDDDSMIGADEEDIILNRFMEPIAEEDYPPDHELDAVEVTLCGLVTRVKVSGSVEQQSCETERVRTVSPIHASFMEEYANTTIKPKRMQSSDFDDTTTTTTCGSHSPQSSLDTVPTGTETLAVRLNASHSLSSPFPIQFKGDSKKKKKIMRTNSPPPRRRVALDIHKSPRQQARSNHPYPIPIQPARTTVPCHIRMSQKSKPPLPSIRTKVGSTMEPAVVSPVRAAEKLSLVDGSLSQTKALETRATNHPTPKIVPRRQSRPPPSPASTLRRTPVVPLKAPKARRRRWSRKNALATAPSIVDDDDEEDDTDSEESEEQSL
eukprot:scaffold91847_cov57-Attheya_sp.AAC.2